MLWVAAVTVFGLANNANGECCHDSIDMIETAPTVSIETIGGEIAPILSESAPLFDDAAVLVEDYEVTGVSYEMPLSMETETFEIESELVVSDVEPVIFGAGQTIHTEVLEGDSFGYPLEASVDGCVCSDYSPIGQYEEVVYFVDAQYGNAFDGAVIEGELITESDETFFSAPVVAEPEAEETSEDKEAFDGEEFVDNDDEEQPERGLEDESDN